MSDRPRSGLVTVITLCILSLFVLLSLYKDPGYLGHHPLMLILDPSHIEVTTKLELGPNIYSGDS